MIKRILKFKEKLHQFGKKIFYTPDAIVWHVINENRTSYEYFHKRTEGHVRTNCISRFQPKPDEVLEEKFFPFETLSIFSI